MKRLITLVMVAGALVALVRRVRLPLRWPCTVVGHYDLTVFGEGEIFNRCVNCRRRTHGWQLRDGKGVAS